MTQGTALERRYGRTPTRRRRGVVVAVIAAAAVLIVTVAWVVWAGLFAPSASLEVRDIGYSDVTDDAITVSWEVTAPTGTAVGCAVQALDDDHAIVGWLVVELPASEQRTRAFEQRLRTSAPAVTGLIYRCWLT